MNKYLQYPPSTLNPVDNTYSFVIDRHLVSGQENIWEYLATPPLSETAKNELTISFTDAKPVVFFAKIDDSTHRYNGGKGLNSNVYEDLLAFQKAEKEFEATNPKVVTTLTFADGSTFEFFEADTNERIKLANALVQEKYQAYVAENFPTGLHFLAITDDDNITDYGLYKRNVLLAEIYVNELKNGDHLHTITLNSHHAKNFDLSLLTEEEKSFFNPKKDFGLDQVEAAKSALLKAYSE
ncbi:TPA: hypothetical protein ACJEU7_001502 [Acinetobacter baumannii]|uniref:hypothetical protein n=1 Tax=Acinetobacter baumannii TaxID=470 RepID=UPI00225B4356|nr:hypothetical protein [Acinetobacter baumannii]MCX3035275.1 hypothetical protein [Acinetobacter baumannii]